MIGNDLIHLPSWPQRQASRRRRFREKVFTPGERSWLEQSSYRDWAEAWLWSIKEAAYKLGQPDPQSRRWAPKEYACVPAENRDLPREGRLQVGQRWLHFWSFWSTTELHSIVLDRFENFQRLHWRVQNYRLNYLPGTGVKLQKDHWAMPYGIKAGQRIPCSRSHDGGRHALAWILLPGSTVLEPPKGKVPSITEAHSENPEHVLF